VSACALCGRDLDDHDRHVRVPASRASPAQPQQERARELAFRQGRSPTGSSRNAKWPAPAAAAQADVTFVRAHFGSSNRSPIGGMRVRPATWACHHADLNAREKILGIGVEMHVLRPT
jgi:hypothetical protein